MKEETINTLEIEKWVKNGEISLTKVLKNEKLTVNFCKEFILNKDEKYCLTEMDKYITLSDILSYQKHLKRSDFEN